MHSYAVHTDSVWALASNPSFSHVYSGGRDLSVSPVLLPTTSIRPLVCGVWTPLSCWSFDALFCLYSQLYLTDLATRESILLCTKEHPILRLASHDDGIWVATTDSSVHKWPVEGHNPQKVFQRGGSFVAGNLSFTRARASLEGSTPVSWCLFLSVLSFYFHFYTLFFWIGHFCTLISLVENIPWQQKLIRVTTPVELEICLRIAWCMESYQVFLGS